MVLAGNFPDPGLIEHNGAYFAFGTTDGKANVPVAFSQDFASWEVKPIDALQDLPGWTSGGIWAPSVTQLVGYLNVRELFMLTNIRHRIAT